MRARLAAAVTPILAVALGPWASAAAAPAPVPTRVPAPVTAPAAAPASPVYTGDIVVTFTESSNSRRAEALARVSAKKAVRLAVKRGMAQPNRVVVSGATRASAPEVAKALAADPAIAAAEPDLRLRATATPSDPYYGAYQWDMKSGPAGIDAPTAWDTTTGTGVTVAVLDTGITTHPDLAGQTVPGYDFISDATTARDGNGRDADPADPGDWTGAGQCGTGSPAANSSWHGTHVAGIIGAAANNSQGISGVAPGATVQNVRVLGACGGSLSDIADAVTWASGGVVAGVPANATPAKVLNLSLGGAGQCYSFMQQAVDGAVARGAAVVVAAGNENVDAATSAPANCRNVIAVGSTGSTGAKSSFSNYGTTIDLSAPGGEGSSSIGSFVVSTVNSGTTTPGSASYSGMVGTSQAAPHVAGVAALMKAANPALTPAQVESTLVSSTHAFGATPTVPMGSGILDAGRAVVAARGVTATPTPAPAPAPAPVAAPTAVADVVKYSTRVTSARVNVLANDTTTAAVTQMHLSGPSCTSSFCLSVNSDGSVQVTKSTRWRGTATATYTFTQSDGQKASATLTVKS